MSLIGKTKDLYSDAKGGNMLGNLIFGKEGEAKALKMVDRYNTDLSNFTTALLDNKNNFKNLIYADDPTVMGFKLKVSYNDPLFNLGKNNNKPSAYKYLLSVNQDARAERLKRFIEKFKLLLSHRNYFLQKLSGLTNIYKVEPAQAFIERTITITTLESIDLHIASMIDDYSRATYDYVNMKQIVPINLLYFDLIIVITEIRQFKTFIEGVIEGDPNGESKTKDADKLSYLNDHLGCHAMRFNMCEFDGSESSDYLNSLDNTAPAPIANKFKIKLGRMDFYLTDLQIFSVSKEKKNFLVELADMPYKVEDLYGSGTPRRFTKEDAAAPEKKSFGKMIGDAIKKEAVKAAKGVVGALDDQLSNTVNLVDSKVRNAAGQLINEYSPSNMASRIVRKQAGKLMSGVNNTLNDTIDGFVDSISGYSDPENWGKKSKSEQLGDRVLTDYKSLNDVAIKNSINRDNKKNLHSPKEEILQKKLLTVEEIKKGNNLINSEQITDIVIDQEPNYQPTETEILRRNVSNMIIHGKSYDEFIKDTLINSASNKSIS